jgi:hypothetical protein
MCDEALEVEGFGEHTKKRFERESTCAEKIHARLYHCPVDERNMVPCNIGERPGFCKGSGKHDGTDYRCNNTAAFLSTMHINGEVLIGNLHTSGEKDE